ncbi:MAG: nucleotide exchange factor GrpE [Bdellovibrionales bacterium]|nr:nucleotide exchange factor GrpE [Bdellovibrionales bacterium]
MNKAHKVTDVPKYDSKSASSGEEEIEFVGVEDAANESRSEGSSHKMPSNKELDELREELEKSKNEYLYLQAEYENHRRQAIKERSDLLKYGAEHLVRDLLNVVDIFDMALQTDVTPENFDQFRKGVEMTSKELLNCFERHGIKKLESHGKPFDPQVHEALSSEATDQIAAGHVHRVHKDAFKLHDRVIRPAQVVVAKEPSEEDKDK